jgi:D-sedoheptulose 7-phosphate isomerase
VTNDGKAGEMFDAAARIYLDDAAAAVTATRDACLDDILEAAALLVQALRAGGVMLICGNGGSAADAQHLATEFVSTFTIDNPRPSIPAVALTTDTSLLTAVANDFGVEGMFARQVESLGRPGDVLIGISTSGNSPNVVRAAAQARDQGMKVLALTGEAGGKLASAADVAIRVPSATTSHIQECHLAIEQLLASLVEDALYPRDFTGSP